MPTKLHGAKRTDAYKFEGEEIANLQISPQLVRWGGLDSDHVEHLARDIAAHGQQAPVLVRKAANGKPELVAGRHRQAAILKINEDPEFYDLPSDSSVPLKANYQNLTEEEAIQASFAENTQLPLSVMDLAQTAEHLARLDWTNEKISRVMTAPHHKVSPSRVSQLRSLIRLPKSVQLQLHRGTMTESTARTLLSMEVTGEQMEKIARGLESGEIKTRDLKAKANEIKREKGKKIKRSMGEVRMALEEIGSENAMNFLSWVDGEVQGDEVLEEIFGEE